MTLSLLCLIDYADLESFVKSTSLFLVHSCICITSNSLSFIFLLLMASRTGTLHISTLKLLQLKTQPSASCADPMLFTVMQIWFQMRGIYSCRAGDNAADLRLRADCIRSETHAVLSRC